MKKILLGMIIGASITSGVFYYIGKQDEDEAKENLQSLLASMKYSKTTQEHLNEILNDPNATLRLPTAMTVITTAGDEYYYYKGNDCSKLVKTDLVMMKDILKAEKELLPADQLMIIIKKMPDAAFRNSIDLLDAISGAGIPAGHFAEIMMTQNEKNCLLNYKKN